MVRDKKYLLSSEIRPLAERSNLMGFLLVVHCYATIGFGLILFSIWPNFFTFCLALMIIGSRQLGLAILMHDAAHRALFANTTLNEKIGLASSMIESNLFSQRWVYENIFGLSQDEWTAEQEQVIQDLKQSYRVALVSLVRCPQHH